MKKAEEYQKLSDDLKDWLKEKEEEADNALPVDDLTSDELKKKEEKAKVPLLLILFRLILLQQYTSCMVMCACVYGCTGLA